MKVVKLQIVDNVVHGHKTLYSENVAGRYYRDEYLSLCWQNAGICCRLPDIYRLTSLAGLIFLIANLALEWAEFGTLLRLKF